ncbi:dynamin family protein [Mariniluteicoccus endophyticus]
MSGSSLHDSLTRLRDALAPVQLPLTLPGAADQAKAVREITAQLDDYILPRLATIDAPLLAVVGGSTGAGKSTLVNSLVGRRVTTPGVIRPTTKAPVLIHHPADVAWFEGDRILPGLTRTTSPSNDQGSIQLVAEETLPRGLAVLDAPDVDSVVEENRRLAAQLLAAADLWLFVTSAARYADAVPWEFLLHAAERSAAVAVVLDRIPPAAMREIPPHLGQMMTQRGLGNSPLFAVPETATDAEGLLPDAAVSPIRSWLATLAHDASSRQEVVYQTLDGAIGALTARTPKLVDAIDDQTATLEQLRSDADRAYGEGARAIQVQTADGTLLKGEVLQRWHDFVGTGEFFRALDEKVGWLRDKIVGAFSGQPKGAEKVTVAVESGLEALLREEGEAAAERAEAVWRANPAGRELLARSREDLSRASRDYAPEAAKLVRDWQGAVMDLVSDQGMEKRSQARFIALGVNTIGLALMIVVFAHTGGLTGAEVGVAGGTSVLAQRALEAVFGDDAVRRLAKQAKDDLDARIEGLMASELRRYHQLLEDLHVEPERAAAIRAAAADVDAARREGLPSAATQTMLTGGDQNVLGVVQTPAQAAPGYTDVAAIEPAPEAENELYAPPPTLEARPGAPAYGSEPVRTNPFERAYSSPDGDGVIDAEIVEEGTDGTR